MHRQAQVQHDVTSNRHIFAHLFHYLTILII